MYIIVSVGLYKREKNGRHAHLKLQLQLLVYDWFRITLSAAVSV